MWMKLVKHLELKYSDPLSQNPELKTRKIQGESIKAEFEVEILASFK